MDKNRVLRDKLTFIKNYLNTVNSFLTLPLDWFYVSEERGERDAYGHQSFKMVDLFAENETEITSELRKDGIETKRMKTVFTFTKC